MSCREIACLSRPIVYVDYMEMEAKFLGPEAVKLVVDNRGVQVDIKEEPTPTDLGRDGLMVTQVTPGLN